MLVNDFFAKVLRKYRTFLSFSNNLYRKLVSLLELLITFNGNLKATLLSFECDTFIVSYTATLSHFILVSYLTEIKSTVILRIFETIFSFHVK